MRNRPLLPILLITVLLAGAFPGCLNDGGGGGVPGRATLIVDFGGASPAEGPEGAVWNFRDLEVKRGETVFTLLLKAAELHNFTVKYHREGYGIFVDEIAGVRGGGKSWWVYYVNGAFGEVASDRKVVKDGDEVLWTYSENPL